MSGTADEYRNRLYKIVELLADYPYDRELQNARAELVAITEELVEKFEEQSDTIYDLLLELDECYRKIDELTEELNRCKEELELACYGDYDL